ncbi:WD repeat-containing protein 47 [Amphibalanus amphitrite]|uniref:WD repeat-containing protein 47 n=1 Tax=Amphibalanus amphitrite TaxID=1232801 RepID=A0A6A4W7W6_AMPAM|nr:WD repeat-containing protein 47 [Amphibalanus amphitrite]
MGARRGLTKHLPAAYSIDREPHRHQSPSKRAAPLHRHRSPSRPGRTLSLGADGQPACCRCGGDLAGSSSSRSARSSTSVTLSSSDDSSRLLYPGDVTNGLMERLHISTNGSMPIEIHGGLHSGFHGEISSGLNSGFHGGIHGGIPSREDEAGWKLFSSPPRHQRRVTLKSERSGSVERPRFIPVTSLEDVQAIRCAEFHPFGKLYAIGSNSKTLRICSYPKLVDLRDDHVTCQSSVVLKRPRHHKGSIYCMAWSPVGDLIATGSNDKTIKLMRFDADSCTMEGRRT